MQSKSRFTVFCIIITLFLFIVTPWTFGAEENLLTNSDFEKANPDLTPEGWRADYWQPTSSLALATKAHQGRYSLEIRSDSKNDARMLQTVKVKPNTFYRLGGWIATENVTPGIVGANFCVFSTSHFYHTLTVNDTTDWNYREMYFKTHAKQNEVTIGARLGMWGNDATGKAYFDDITLIELKDAPANFQTIEPDPSETGTSSEEGKASFSFVSLWFALLVVAAIALVIFAVFRKKTPKKRRVKKEREEDDEQEPDDEEPVSGDEDEETQS